MDKFERRLVLDMMINALRHGHLARASASNLDRALTTAVPYILEERYGEQTEDCFPVELHEVNLENRAEIKSAIKSLEYMRDHLSSVRPGTLEINLRKVSRFFGFSQLEHDVLGAIVRNVTGDPWEELTEIGMMALRSEGLALALGKPLGSIRKILEPSSPLLVTGLVRVDMDGDIAVLKRLVMKIQDPNATKQPVTSWLLPAPSRSSLSLGDFDYIEAPVNDAMALLRAARDRSEWGIHILLHGKPGTGKTELAKTIAAALGMDLYAIGETDELGNEPIRRERLDEYRLAQSLLKNDPKALILFDEAEDVFQQGHFLGARFRASEQSKVFMHRLLEQATVPTIWTTNDTDDMGTAILRRMSYAIEMPTPNIRTRARIWERALSRAELDVDQGEVRELANEFCEAPALVVSAVRVARLMDGEVDAARRSLNSIRQVMTGRPVASKRHHTIAHDPGLINSDQDLLAIERSLVGQSAASAVSFCISGPPGTGKSAWVRHLAGQMGLETIERRASDLLSPLVGMTEKAIASCFQEARDTRAFLVIDEADSLLGDRRSARTSWEITQVNEFLTWMESHAVPFAMTTNFAEHLDPASLRRFVFKLKFDFMTPEQARSAFRAFFAMEGPNELGWLNNLTPGDFANVRRRARIMGQDNDAYALMHMLTAEAETKPGSHRRIGFAA